MALKPPADPPVTQARLPSGLRVLVIALPHLHTAALLWQVRVGSRFETSTTAGLSHFVEHMVYRGSKRHPSAFALNRAFELAGGGLYAETSREITSYLVECPSESALDLLVVLGDAIANPLWRDLETEQRIVLEEILEDLDEQGRLIQSDDLARRAAWGPHPLAHPIAGTQHSVASFDVDRVIQHHRQYYTGTNSVLCVAGPVDPEAVIARATTAFADLPQGEVAIPEPAPDSFQGPHTVYVHHRESQTSLTLLVHGLGDAHPLNPAQSILYRVIDDGLSTRLHRRVVDELGLAYQVGATPELFEDTVVVDFAAQCTHDSTPALVQAVGDLFRDLKHAPPDAEEFEMARQRIRWDVQSSHDNPRSLAEYWATMTLYGRDRPLSQRLGQILAATQADVHEVAQTLFQPERLALACVGRLTRAQQQRLADCLGAMAG